MVRADYEGTITVQYGGVPRTFLVSGERGEAVAEVLTTLEGFYGDALVALVTTPERAYNGGMVVYSVKAQGGVDYLRTLVSITVPRHHSVPDLIFPHTLFDLDLITDPEVLTC